MTSNTDFAIKVVKMEADISAIRTEVTHSNQLARAEMQGVKTSVDRITDAVELLLKNSQETALLRQDLFDTKHDVSELSQRMDRRQATTDPLILEAQQFLSSFKTGAGLVVKGLGILQLIFIMWFGYNETRISDLETRVHELTVESAILKNRITV